MKWHSVTPCTTPIPAHSLESIDSHDHRDTKHPRVLDLLVEVAAAFCHQLKILQRRQQAGSIFYQEQGNFFSKPTKPEANSKNVKMGMKPQRQIPSAAFGTVQTTANSWTGDRKMSDYF